MVNIYKGSVQLLANKIKIGANNAAKVYRGATLIFPPASSAVLLDTSAGGTYTGAAATYNVTSLTIAANANRYLVVFIASNASSGQAISGVTWDGVAMSLLGSVNDTGTGDQKMWAYGLKNPNSGNKTLAVTHTQDCFATVEMLSFYGVDQTTPVGTAMVQNYDGQPLNNIIATSCAGFTNGLSVGAGFGWWSSSGSITARTPLPSYVASGALLATATVTSRTPLAPAGLNAGDIEIATCSSENNATHGVSGSGWTALGSPNQFNSGAGWTTSYWYRRYDGTNVNPVISWTGSADAHARRHGYRGGLESGTPLLQLGTVGTGTSATHTSTGGNTTQANSTAIYLDDALANTAIATPSTWTEDVDSGSATGPCRTAGGHKEITGSGSASGNISVTGASAAWVQRQVEMLCSTTVRTNRQNRNDGNQFMKADTAPGAAYNAFTWTAAASAFSCQAISVGLKAA